MNLTNNIEQKKSGSKEYILCNSVNITSKKSELTNDVRSPRLWLFGGGRRQ